MMMMMIFAARRRLLVIVHVVLLAAAVSASSAFLPLEVDSSNTNNNNNSSDCSSKDQNVFIAETEFVLLGSNQFLNSVERTALQNAFVDIYNQLTRDACDSFYRKLKELSFVSMTNGLNETLTALQVHVLEENNKTLLPPPSEQQPEQQPQFEPEQQQQQPPPDDFVPTIPEEGLPDSLPPLPEDGLPDSLPPLPEDPPPFLPPGPFGRLRRQRRLLYDNVNETIRSSTSDETQEAGVSISYNVTGTCRDCPLTRSGSFELYDDSFRRHLHNNHLGIRVRVRRIQVISQFATPPQDEEEPPQFAAPQEEQPQLPPPSDNNNNSSSSLPSLFENDNDCECAPGLVPTTGRAPKISELIDFMNERLEIFQTDQQQQQQQIMFQDLVLETIRQLDDWSSLDES